MWPWAHAAVAYLLYTTITHTHDQRPTPHAALAVGLGALTPDLVDKPLAWTIGILPTGRSLMHSALTATLLTLLLVYLANRRRHAGAYYAFALGIWTHIITDALPGFEKLAYLAWPLLPSPDYPTEPSFIAHLETIHLTPWFILQLLLTALALIVWYRDGTPGLTLLDPRTKS